MTTAYTTILKLALPVQGELSGTWGDVVNDNITQMVEQAVAGKAVVNTWAGNSHTLTTADGTTSESRCAILELTDSGTALTGAGTVVCPTNTKLYIVDNNTAQIVTVKTSGGTGVAVPVGKTMLVYCDGTNVVEGVTHANSLSLGTSTVTADKILDEDNMASDSATAIATQQSIKAYVDSQVGSFDTLAEVLAQGNTTGGTDLAVSTGDDITFADNSKAIFGAGSDLQIYHDAGGTSHIRESGSNNLYIESTNFRLKSSTDTGETYLTANLDGAVTLYYDNAVKLATTATGIDVTGDITLGDTNPTITFEDSSVVNLSHTIQSSSDNLRLAVDVNGVDAGSRVEIFDGSTEVARFSAGAVDITGTVTADGLTVQSGVADIRAGNIGPSSNASVNIGRADTSIASGNPLGYVQFLGSDNTAGSLTPHAYIGAIAASTHSAGSNPTEIVFGTTATSSETILERLKISDNGDLSLYEDTGTTPKFFWDASAERLGIGTSSPEKTLHVNSGTGNIGIRVESSDATASIEFMDSGTTSTALSPRIGGISDDFFVQTNGAERMRITSTGIDVTGSVTATGIVGASDGTNGEMQFGLGTALTTGAGTYDSSVRWNGSSGNLLFSQGAVEKMRITSTGIDVTGSVTADGLDVNSTTSGAANIQVGNAAGDIALGIGSPSTANKVVVTAGGSVGIGTTSPDYPLHVKGTTNILKLETSTDGRTQLGGYDSSGNTNFLIGSTDSTNVELWNYKNGYVRFATNSTERMHIDASGNVGIGTSSPSDFDTWQRQLVVGSGSADAGITIYHGSGAGNQGAISFADGNTGTDRYRGIISYNGADEMKFATATATRMTLDASGNLLVGVTSTTLTGGSLTLPNSGIVAFHDAGGNARNVLQFVSGNIKHGAAGGGVTTQSFYTDNTLAVTIDSSQNLLVGLTSTTGIATGATADNGVYVDGSVGAVVAQSSANKNLYLSKATGYSDPDFISFQVDGASVGSISIAAGPVAYIVLNDATSDNVAALKGASGAILPSTNAGADKDGTMNLGSSDARFESLFLSGGVYLGGAVAANKLEDYEEGTFTLTTDGDATGAFNGATTCYYTKVGRTVHVIVAFRVGTNFTGQSIGGFPFAFSHTSMASSYLYVGGSATSANNTVSATAGNASTTLRLHDNHNTSDAHLPNTTDEYYRFNFSYQTA